MEFKDYYKTLDVATDADKKAIKLAYRRLARKYHPDLSHQSDAAERFKDVAEAYEVLKDDEKRAEYDELRKYGQHGQPFSPPPGWQPGGAAGDFSNTQGNYSDFFSSIFGQDFGSGTFNQHADPSQSQFSARGQDIETDLPVFLEDTLRESTKTVSFELSGESKTLNVKLPSGVANGERIRLKAQGTAGFNGGENGDLYLRIRLVPHPLFDIEGHNLIVILPLAPWEAVLGTKIDIPTLTGRVRLTIPPNSQSGQRLRIKNRGLVKKTGGHGDLYAHIKIVTPEGSSEADKAVWQNLAQSINFDPRKDWSDGS